MTAAGLTVWVVYDRGRLPLPRYFQAQEQAILPGQVHPTGALMYAMDVEVIRSQLGQLGFVRLHRGDDDDPTILETWL